MKHGSLHLEPELSQNLHRKAKIAAGHVTGIAKMIEDDKYCIDILKQIAAVQGTLTAIAWSCPAFVDSIVLDIDVAQLFIGTV